MLLYPRFEAILHIVFKVTLLSVIFLGGYEALSAQETNTSKVDVDSSLTWPVKWNSTISATYGEYRPGHIHIGMDFRTRDRQGGLAVGIPALAVGDGYISRIRITPNGYAKSIYLTLNDGKSARYAHLDGFIPAIDDYIRLKQKELRKNNIDIELPPDLFVFRKGEEIAYTGNSGTKIAHLHFELFEPSGTSVNPMHYGLTVQDSRQPSVRGTAVIPLDAYSEADGDCIPRVYATNFVRGDYKVLDIPKVYGKFGFGVRCADKADDTPNNNAPYGFELSLGQDILCQVKYDSCDLTAFLQSDIDRDPYLNKNGRGVFQRIFRSDNCDITFHTGNGIIDTREYEPGVYDWTIRVDDFYENGVEIKGKVEFLSAPIMPEQETINEFTINGKTVQNDSISSGYSYTFFNDFIRIQSGSSNPKFYWQGANTVKANFHNLGKSRVGRIKFDESNVGHNYFIGAGGKIIGEYIVSKISPSTGGIIASDDSKFRIEFPPDAVFDTIFPVLKEIDVRKLNLPYRSEGRAFKMEPDWIPFKKPAVIKWETDNTDLQAGIYYLNGGGKPVFLGSARDSLTVKGSCRNFETFVLIYDREPPQIRFMSPKISRGLNTRYPKFKFKIGDGLSGINSDSVEAYIDGEWIPLDYDQQRASVYVKVKDALPSGKHILILKCADKCGNENSMELNFRVN